MEREGHCIKRGSAESEGRGAGAPGAAEGGTRPSGPRRIPRRRCGEQAVCYLSAAADDGSGVPVQMGRLFFGEETDKTNTN